ncbi:hypothetical protein [Victivallis sp. Marseille-Q1083]|nr:hypothetical protein [Victivallis sp. Marseille-Q1083]
MKTAGSPEQYGFHVKLFEAAGGWGEKTGRLPLEEKSAFPFL